MILGFGNNVVSSLASDITASQTTFSVLPGDGPLFAALLTSDFSNKSTTLKNYAKITLTDSGETAFEVCHLTAVNGDTLTVIRGQEGTTAKGWALKDAVANFATRGSENSFPQIAHIQSGFYTSGTAGGTANALTLELPTTFFLNGSADWVLKTPIVVYPSQNNTGAATLQLTMGGRVLGTFPLYKGNKAALVANDILKDVALVCLLDNTKTFFNVANPGAIYAGLGTAAFKDAVTSMTDTTAGRVPVVGWMGLGGVAPRSSQAANSSYDSIPAGLPSGFWTHTLSGGPFAYSFALQQDGGGVNNTRHFIMPADTNGKIAIRWDDGATFRYQYFYTDKNKPTAEDVDALPLKGGTVTGEITGAYTGTFMWNDQYNTKAPFYHDFTSVGTSEYHPLIKQRARLSSNAWVFTQGVLVGGTELTWHLYMRGSAGQDINHQWDTKGNYNCPGQVIPGNYANLDARYLTKSENLPVGIPLPWPTATPPSGWLICNGSAFNKTTCPQLAAAYPGGYLPDLRAQFIRGLDNGKNIDTGRAILSTQAGQSPYSSVGSTYGNTSWNSRATVKTGYYMTTGTDNDGTYQIMSESQAQRETRPTNVAFNYIVRAA